MSKVKSVHRLIVPFILALLLCQVALPVLAQDPEITDYGHGTIYSVGELSSTRWILPTPSAE